jgi:nitrate reductase gamma subunit
MIKAFDIFFILLALAIFSWGVYRRSRLWTIGKKDSRSNNMWARIKSFLVEGIIHRRILQDRYPGLIHLFIFLGFMVPLIIIILTQFLFTLPALLAQLLSLGLDIIGLAAVVFLLLAMYRRYVSRPSRLDNQLDDFISLALLILILLTGFTLEGLRLSVIGEDTQAWAPVG